MPVSRLMAAVASSVRPSRRSSGPRTATTMQNSVAPATCERRAASTMPSTSSQAARTGVGKRADCEQNAQSSLQPPVLADTIDSTETSGPQCARRTRWASAHSSGTRSGVSAVMRRASSRASGSPRPSSCSSSAWRSITPGP